MLKKSMLLVALVAFGCGEEKSEPTNEDKDGKVTKDASTKDARTGSSSGGNDAASDEPSDGDAGTEPVGNGEPQPIDDAGSIEVKTPDGGKVVITPGQDGGTQLSGMGSCCSEHPTPGCNNADLMVCVCEKKKACCTDAWTKDCALIVTQRYCQEGVRDCVINQWGQTKCMLDWTDACNVVGEQKCEQVPGCF